MKGMGLSCRAIIAGVASALLAGCVQKTPVSIGSSYTVDGKPGSQAACFQSRSDFVEWKALMRSAPEKVLQFESDHATFLKPGDRAMVLAKSAHSEDFKVKVLSSGVECYVANGGGGPGLGLFASDH